VARRALRWAAKAEPERRRRASGAAGATLYEGLAARYVRPVISDVGLDKLTPAHVQRLVTVFSG
jgi:hypothetical protein